MTKTDVFGLSSKRKQTQACLTCGCLVLETQVHAVLVCEPIRTCILLSADAQSSPDTVSPLLAQQLLATFKQYRSLIC